LIDTVTRKPIEVETDSWVEPQTSVPLVQLKQITDLLDANGIFYWVDEEVLSIDDGPEIALITLDYRTDTTRVQRLLDDLPRWLRRPPT
jgi:hypothetical protein